jgi:hypothetical protein
MKPAERGRGTSQALAGKIGRALPALFAPEASTAEGLVEFFTARIDLRDRQSRTTPTPRFST